MKHHVAALLLLPALLVACPQAPIPEVKPPVLEQPFTPTLLGSLEVQFGADAKVQSTKFVPNRVSSQVLAPVTESTLVFNNQQFQAIDVPSTTNRYLKAQFDVTNNSAVARQNLTLVAYRRANNSGGSAIGNVQTFGVLPAPDVNLLQPIHAMITSGPSVIVDNANADLQIFKRSEVTAITALATSNSLINVTPTTGEGILNYGYVARKGSTSTYRTIPANTCSGANCNKGTISIALRVPQASDPNTTAYRFNMTFLVFTDSVARVAESLEEQGTTNAATRAGALTGGASIASMCGTSQTSSTFIPGVRTVGVGTDTAWMGGNFFDSTETALNLTGIVGNTEKTYAGTNGVLNGRFTALGGATLGASARAIGSATTTNGGNLGIATNGDTTIRPLVNSRAADGFTYQITDGTCTSPNIAATIAAPANTVWYVDSGAAGGGDGRSNAPFQNLSSVNASATTGSNNDFIYVKGTGTNTATLTMKTGQQLIGSGVALVVNSVEIVPIGTAPVIVNPIVLNNTAGNNTIRGLTIRSLTGTGFGTLTMNSASIAAGANQAINLTNGALAATLTKVDSSGGVHGIQLTNTTGSLSVTGTGTTAGSGGVLNANTQDGVNLATQFGSVTLKNMQITSPANEGVDAKPSTGTNLLRLEDVTIVTPSTSAAATHEGIDYVGSGSSVNTLEVIGTVAVTSGNSTTVASRIQAGDTFGIFVGTGTGSSASMTFKLEKTSIRDNAAFSVNAVYLGSGATISTLDGNFIKLTTIDGAGIRVDTDTTNQTHKLRITGNTIDLSTTPTSGASTGIDLRVRRAAQTQAIIESNVITNAQSNGILAFVGSAGANTANAQLTLTSNNISSAFSDTLDGVHILSGSGGTGSIVCLNAVGNTSNFTGVNSITNYYLERITGNTFNLNGLASAVTTLTGVQNWLLNTPRSNLPNTPTRVDAVGLVTPGFSPATCTVPTF